MSFILSDLSCKLQSSINHFITILILKLSYKSVYKASWRKQNVLLNFLILKQHWNVRLFSRLENNLLAIESLYSPGLAR